MGGTCSRHVKREKPVQKFCSSSPKARRSCRKIILKWPLKRHGGCSFGSFCKGCSNVPFKRLIEILSKVLGKRAYVTDVWKYSEKLWNHKDEGKPKYLHRIPSHCHIIYHKSHMVWPGTERGPPRWEAGDWQPELIGLVYDNEQSRSLKWSFFTSQATGLLRLSPKCYKGKRHILLHPHLAEVPKLDYPSLLRQH
jgi:hypothetical protein